MMRRIRLLLPLLAVALSGCEGLDDALNAERVRGSGKVTQEQRDLRNFNEVMLAAVGELNIQQGDRESLSIEAEDNIMPRIKTDVEEGRLVIRTERGVSLSPTVPIRYRLMVKELRALELSGSGKVHTGGIRSQDFAVRLPGSGEIQMDELNADSLTAEISGSGSIELPGKVNSQKVRISGSGDYNARNLHSRSADVSISGSGESTVWAQEDLSAHISGSGNIEYYGNPRVSKHISGSGGINNAGDHP